MGGLGPGIGGLEILVIGLVALLVVGPKDLPVLMRKVGKFMARARAMASDFRSSFDEMARQSELDELRKEVEALRTGQMVPLGAEADRAFRDIRDDLNKPLYEGGSQPVLAGPEEWPDGPSVMTPLDPEPVKKAPRKAAAPRKTAPAAAKPKTPAKARPRAATAKPRATRKKAADL